MIPLPWSHSRLEDFKNCPRAFHEKQVLKSVVEEKGEESIWGTRVHKHFEEFLIDGVALPPELEEHEDFLLRLMSLPGQLSVEQRIALNMDGAPCDFFQNRVWYRGVIDVKIVDGATAYLVDHKTGKVKNNFRQLKSFALHTFAAHPAVTHIKADYYWTQTKKRVGETYTRADISGMWAEFAPDLRQYAQAFREDTWQPRQSGLCNGWCPVTGCEFWQPKRRKG